MPKVNDLHIREFRPSKSMGQNFLIDDNISKKIVRLAGVDRSCGVLEVGPGFGALTRHLVSVAGHVTAVETDARLSGNLREVYKECKNITIIQEDILRTDLNALTQEKFRGLTAHVCANLPYNITTPAISHFIDAGVFKSITVMIQKEVARRFCAMPATPDYGAISVYINYFTEPETLFDVPPECFSPRPKVMSSVIKLTVRERRVFDGYELSAGEEKQLFRVIRAAFGQRRKTLVNAMFAEFKKTHSKEELTKAVETCGFDANIRGEVLNVEEFVRLSVTIC